MGQFKSEEVEREAVRMVAALMAASARTAPKARGIDAIETMVIDGDDLELLAGAMEAKAKEQPPYLSPVFIRDAGNVRNSSCVVLIGVTGNPKKIEMSSSQVKAAEILLSKVLPALTAADVAVSTVDESTKEEKFEAVVESIGYTAASKAFPEFSRKIN